MAGDDEPAAGAAGPAGHPGRQVGDGTLRVARRREGVSGARPERTDVPEDADGAPGRSIAVGAPPPGDEEDEAETDHPRSARLGCFRHRLDERPGIVQRQSRHLSARPRAGDGPRAEQQSGAGDQAEQPGRGVGQRGRGPDPGDLPGPGGVRPLLPVLLVDLRFQGAGGEPGAYAQYGGGNQQQHQEHGDHGGLPAEQHRRPVDDGRPPHAGGAGAVEPVGDALGDPAGHDAAEGAGEHRDRGATESVQDRTRLGRPAVQAERHHREGDHESALADGEDTERDVSGERARGDPAGAGPGGVHGGEGEQGEGGARQTADDGAVEPVVDPPLAAAASADHPEHNKRAQHEHCLEQPAEEVGHGAADGTVVPGGGARDGGRHGQEPGGGVRGPQPGDEPPAVPEAGAAEGGVDDGGGGGVDPADGGAAGTTAGRVGRNVVRNVFVRSVVVRLGAGERALRLVRAPGPVGQVPEQPHQRGGHQGREREPAARLRPPAALRRRQEAEPGPPVRAVGYASALPGHQIERDLAGRRGEQHGEAEGDEPDEHAVQPHRAGAALGGGPHPVGQVDHHEREQQEPERAGTVAGGEVGPAVGLFDGPVPVPLGVLLGVDVPGATVDGRRRVTGDPGDTRIVEHALGSGSADAMDEQFQRGPRALRGLGDRGHVGDSLSRSCDVPGGVLMRSHQNRGTAASVAPVSPNLPSAAPDGAAWQDDPVRQTASLLQARGKDRTRR